MNRVGHYYGNQSDMENREFPEGSLVFTKDTQKIYRINENGEKILYGGGALATIQVKITNGTAKGVKFIATGQSETGLPVSYYAYTDSWGVANIPVAAIGTYTISSDRSGVVFPEDPIVEISEYLSVANLECEFFVEYTVRIDENNSNPLTCCEYLDDAENMVKGSDDWDTSAIFNDIKPCTFIKGEVNYYLDKNDFNLKENGDEANLTGTDGDVMIEFPKFAYRLYREENEEEGSSYLYVSMTNNKDKVEEDGRYHYYAFSKEEEGDRDKFYLGAYISSMIKNRYYSLPNQSISGNEASLSYALTQIQEGCQKKGDGYTYLGFYQLLAIQCLYVIKYGNLNSQEALGCGVSYGSIIETGGTEKKGMYYGERDNYGSHCKFAGLEDVFGNVGILIRGASRSSVDTYSARYDYDKLTEKENFTLSMDLPSNSYAYTKKVVGTTEFGFLRLEGNASSNTYYCDYGFYGQTGNLVFSKSASSHEKTWDGIFYSDIYGYTAQSTPYYNRLMYL